MVVLAASMGGVSVDQVDRATINMVISGTSIGTIWQVRVAALLLVLYFSIVGWRRPAFALGSLSVTAAIALATLAWTGGRSDCRSEEHTSELQSLMRNSYFVFCSHKKNRKYPAHRIPVKT